MLGLIGPRIQERQPRVDNQLMVRRHCFFTGVFLQHCGAVPADDTAFVCAIGDTAAAAADCSR
jgi:hypothetical protein